MTCLSESLVDRRPQVSVDYCTRAGGLVHTPTITSKPRFQFLDSRGYSVYTLPPSFDPVEPTRLRQNETIHDAGLRRSTFSVMDRSLRSQTDVFGDT